MHGGQTLDMQTSDDGQTAVSVRRVPRQRAAALALAC
jgi:hypothetical protein